MKWWQKWRQRQEEKRFEREREDAYWRASEYMNERPKCLSGFSNWLKEHDEIARVRFEVSPTLNIVIDSTKDYGKYQLTKMAWVAGYIDGKKGTNNVR